VDVRPANALDLKRAQAPHPYAVLAEARHELRQPEFPGQQRFDAAGQPEAQAPPALLQAGRPPKPNLPYTPAASPLNAITGDFSLVLHVSPDAGWDRLSDFLSGVRSRLVVGMYDFTSAHVLQAVEDALSDAGRTLKLTLDHPARNPTADQSDDETRDALGGALGGRFSGAWALTKGDPKATAWIFPTAYHIKVAVRDDDATWLSSGNWNNSNQPQIDLSDLPGARRIAAKSDRDWHVIATNTDLADTFRAYLEQDFTDANGHNATLAASPFAAASGATPLDATTVDVPADALAAGRSPRKFFAPTTVSGTFTVQPLLSPDNYQPQILQLIRSATSRFYMQTQYIHPASGPNDQGHADLIQAVQDLINGGVDVRLITSEYETADWLEKLKDVGFDISRIRLQPKVHNKGIVVDSRKVVVSSQNWSADGTLRNRDAGLIIENADAAAYFERIFLYDWDNLAAQRTLL
ncbi:MAG TPA: phospholipase D-like domain-containing protein, partial [Phenylobacterium sp.]|nr:phospholipase D-like domain-containing protein [Phenylobacterium sp.]